MDSLDQVLSTYGPWGALVVVCVLAVVALGIWVRRRRRIDVAIIVTIRDTRKGDDVGSESSSTRDDSIP